MDKNEPLYAIELFKNLRAEQIARIHDATNVVNYKPGDFVYEKGKKTFYLYVVLKGHVTLRMPLRANMSLVIDDCRQGTLFGVSIFYGMEKYTLNAQVMEDSEILRIDYSVLQHMMDEDMIMGLAIHKEVGHIFYSRYINAMENLQAVLMNLDLERD